MPADQERESRGPRRGLGAFSPFRSGRRAVRGGLPDLEGHERRVKIGSDHARGVQKLAGLQAVELVDERLDEVAISLSGLRRVQPPGRALTLEPERGRERIDRDLGNRGRIDVRDMLAAEGNAVAGDLDKEPVADRDHVVLVAPADIDAVGVVRHLLADVQDRAGNPVATPTSARSWLRACRARRARSRSRYRR